MSSLLPLRALVCLTVLLPLTAAAQAPSGDQTPQTADSAPGVPTFYANARQVIVEAEVWKPVDKKHPDPSWMQQGSLDGVPGAVAETLKRMPPPAKGLTAGDFHVFDNGVEQKINYFKEADFPYTGTGPWWMLHPTAQGTWGAFLPPGPTGGQTPSAAYLLGYVPPWPAGGGDLHRHIVFHIRTAHQACHKAGRRSLFPRQQFRRHAPLLPVLRNGIVVHRQQRRFHLRLRHS